MEVRDSGPMAKGGSVAGWNFFFLQRKRIYHTTSSRPSSHTQPIYPLSIGYLCPDPPKAQLRGERAGSTLHVDLGETKLRHWCGVVYFGAHFRIQARKRRIVQGWRVGCARSRLCFLAGGAASHKLCDAYSAVRCAMDFLPRITPIVNPPAVQLPPLPSLAHQHPMHAHWLSNGKPPCLRTAP
jgi:hypothetical protein